MIRFIRRFRYTIAMAVIFLAALAWMISGWDNHGGLPWWEYPAIAFSCYVGSFSADEVRKRRKQ